jgi:hypothetical protein
VRLTYRCYAHQYVINAATYILPIVPSYVSTMLIILHPYIADFISPCIYIIITCIHVPPAHFSDYVDVITTRRRTRIHTLFPRIPSMYLACVHDISVMLIDHFAHHIIICSTHPHTNVSPCTIPFHWIPIFILFPINDISATTY